LNWRLRIISRPFVPLWLTRCRAARKFVRTASGHFCGRSSAAPCASASSTIANRPDGISRAEIIAAVYADGRNGGPDNPNVISVLIKHADAQLAAQGFRIGPAWRRRGARYRLTRLP
jgi:hypothetical protein